jgi:TRAP-type C4-dicarboxylate transport system substrate-binding protein
MRNPIAMKTLPLYLSIALGMLLSSLLAPPASAAAKYTLKFAMLAPEGSAWMLQFDELKKQVLEATGGQVQFKAYPGGVLGEEKDILFKMKVGQVDGGGFLGAGTAKICPEASALMVPLLFNDYGEVDAVLAKMTPMLERVALDNGYVTLGWVEIGFSHVYSTRPVQGLEDLRNAKPWMVPADPLVAELFRVARVSAIQASVADVLTALQTGLLQTVYAPPLACVAMQWFTKVKYVNDLRLGYSIGGLFVSAKSWDRIPEDLRGKIVEVCRAGMKALTVQVRRSNEESLDVLKRNGIETVTMSKEQIAEFLVVGRTTAENLKGSSYSAEAYDQVQKALAEARAAGGAVHAP